MPHKRAKLSARQTERAKREMDLPPGEMLLIHENMPKSMARVLKAEELRMAYREKRARIDKGSAEDATEHGGPKRQKREEAHKRLEIKHGESLTKYNRRVDDEMRFPVAEAMHASRGLIKRVRSAEIKAAKARDSNRKLVPSREASPYPEVPSDPPGPVPSRKTEFLRRESITRLNDIVQEPPNLTKFPRGVTSLTNQGSSGAIKAGNIISMAQRQMMQEERAKAVKRYRELKQTRTAT